MNFEETLVTTPIFEYFLIKFELKIHQSIYNINANKVLAQNMCEQNLLWILKDNNCS